MRRLGTVDFMSSTTLRTEAPTQPSGIPQSAGGRLMSLDVFRGATIAAMILVNDPGDGAAAYWPLRHSHWNGWTPTDLVFPFFVFIVGVAMAFSFTSRIKRGESRGRLLLHVLWRGVVLFALGLVVNGFPRPLPSPPHLWSAAENRAVLCRHIGAGAVDGPQNANWNCPGVPDRILDRNAVCCRTGIWRANARHSFAGSGSQYRLPGSTGNSFGDISMSGCATRKVC